MSEIPNIPRVRSSFLGEGPRRVRPVPVSGNPADTDSGSVGAGKARNRPPKIDPASFLLMQRDVIGKMRSYVVFPAYGFIVCEVDGITVDVFFSGKDIGVDRVAVPSGRTSVPFLTLAEGQEVRFDLEASVTLERIFRAKNISAANGGLLLPDEIWLRRHDTENLTGQVRRLSAELEKTKLAHRDSQAEVARHLCMICMDKSCTHLYTPCNHVVACDGCATLLKQKKPESPEEMPATWLPPVAGYIKCPKCKVLGKLVRFYLP